MLVTVFIKIGVPGNPTVGKISEILPVRPAIEYGKQTLDSFIPVVMDLKIPCNDTESDLFPCGKCKWNDYELCDRIKYLRNIWSAGDVFNEPKAIGGMYKVDYSKFISAESLEVYKAYKKEVAVMDTIMTQATNNQKAKDIILEVK